MLQQIKKFLRRHKDNILLKTLWQFKQATVERRAIKRLQKLKNIHIANRKIRVLFIVIDSNTWNKIKSLYIAMKLCDQIALSLVCCPDPHEKDTAKTYNYFVAEGYDCIDARIGRGSWDAISGKGKWFDIKQLQPDYIFYTEPYNSYLPKKYRSNVTSSYAKVCIVPYGMTTTKEFLAIRPRNFYCDVYLCYTNNEDEKNYNIEQFAKPHQCQLQYTKYLGFLAFSDFVAQSKLKSEAWNFSQNKMRFIWTPRWTLNEDLGGSNFFRYKNILFDYAQKNQNIDFLFRPHPMALDNFLKTGKMTQEEVDQFMVRCENEKNLRLDTRSEYTKTFWQSSVLVTDISSIIVEYFITGKPIVFCKSLNTKQTYLAFFAKILDACYVVNNEKELVTVLDYLKMGHDKKKIYRQKLVAEIFGDISMNTPNKIINDVLQDANGK